MTPNESVKMEAPSNWRTNGTAAAEPRLSTNEWKTSAELAGEAEQANQNPFAHPHDDAVEDEHVNRISMHDNERQDANEINVAPPGHSYFAPNAHGVGADEPPKALSPVVINMPPASASAHESRIEYSQKKHRNFLIFRLVAQCGLFLLAVLGYVFSASRPSWRGIMENNGLEFVLIWTLILLCVYATQCKMSKSHDEKEQWKRILRMIFYDVIIVTCWLIMSYCDSSKCSSMECVIDQSTDDV